jgi:hypothetical protein
MSNRLPPLISKIETVNAGTGSSWYGFPTEGANRGAIVANCLVLTVLGTVDVATALMDGRDIPRLVGNITVKQRSGGILRWNNTGDEVRIMSMLLDHPRRYLEHPNLAIGAGRTLALRLVLPLRKRLVKRGKDFAMHTDELELVSVTWNSLAGWASGGAVLSNLSATAYIQAEWHEELTAEVKSVDVVKSTNFTDATQCQLSLEGAVHDMVIYKTGTTGGGGESLAAITGVRCPELGIQDQQLPADLVGWYSRKRDIAPTAFAATPSNEQVLDPFREGKAIPVIVADAETSTWDGAVVKTAILRVTGGTTGCAALTRQVVERPEAAVLRMAQRYGIPVANFYAKTLGKTRRDLSAGWTERQQLVMTLSGGRIPATVNAAA